MYDDILVPTDGSEQVQEAIDEAIGIAETMDATIHALYVVDTADYVVVPDAQALTVESALREAGEAAVEEVRSRAADRGVESTTAVREGNPAEQILEYASDQGIDLIVMGTHGRSNIDRVLLGSVTENVIRNADRPVLVRRLKDE